MSGSCEEKKTYYRLTPCPAYDVEGMESWLEDLAEKGLFLTRDGFFCGFGFFHREEPRKVKYRLQAHISRVILRNGNKVLRGSFHEYSDGQEEKLSMEEWAALLAESLK